MTADRFLWQLTRPSNSKDVELVLGPIFSAWDENELEPVARAIGRQLIAIGGVLRDGGRA